MKDSNELRAHLAQFTGTENYYRHALVSGFVYTDGFKAFMDNAGGGAYWFGDILATEPAIRTAVKKEGFQIVVLDAQENLRARITCAADINGDGAESIFEDTSFTRKIEFTDCPTGSWKFYLVWDGTRITALVPSEY